MNTSGVPIPQTSMKSGYGAVRLWGRLQRIFTEPFLPLPADLLALPLQQLEARRRAGLFRLILFSVIAVLCLLVIPLALISRAEFTFVRTLVSELLLALVCLLVGRLRQVMLAGFMFAFGSLILGVVYALFNPEGLNIQGLLLYGILSIVALIAGLILPIWAIWLCAAALIGATVPGILLTPLSPELLAFTQNVGDASALRLGAVSLIVSNQALAAVLGWMNARITRAGMAGARRAIERERELAALKDQFLIAANHELRTPIMTWFNNMEIISLLGQRATDEQRARLLARALTSGRLVLRLLATVLDVGALEVGAPQVSLRPVPVGALVRDIVESFDPRLIGEPGLEDVGPQTREILVDIDDDLWVMADEDRMRQIIINLLTNAVKYSESGTGIVISARAESPPMPSRRGLFSGLLSGRGRPTDVALKDATPMWAKICVRDYGLGVPPHDAPKLFQRFVRLERDIAGSVRGTGVGLYLCRILVQAMGGRIWVESSGVPGEGSTFCFTLRSVPAIADTMASSPMTS